MARTRRRDRWTKGDLIALAVGVIGGGTGLVYLARWLADVVPLVLVLAVLAGVALLRCVTGLLAALFAR